MEQTGFTPFLDDQFASNVSTFPDPTAANIAVNNQVLVREADRRADLQEELQASLDRKAARVAPGIDALPWHVFHRQVGEAVVGDAAAQKRGDVGVVQFGHDLAFTAEPLFEQRRVKG